jgi:hypothetical protein
VKRIARARFVVVVLALSFVFAGAAYAYGIQRHTVSSYDHGCGYTVDPGCTGANDDDGDYNKRGFTKWTSAVDYLNTEIWYAVTNSFRTRGDCSNCMLTNPAWDTNPTFECRFKTWHVAYNNGVISLNGHWHWTQAATNTTGGC